jgi:hypothetical protein
MGSWSEAAEFGIDAIGPLTIALRDQNPKVRQNAAETLGVIGGREAADALGAALVDKGFNATVRAIIAQELGRIGGEHVIAYLTAALSDKEWMVRTAAAQSLTEMDWTPLRPWDRALHAIARGRIEDAVEVGETAIPALADALRFPTVSASIGSALAQMGRAGIDALVQISKDSKVDIALREAASTALASIGDSRAVEPLHAMLKDTDPAVRHTAVWALERLGWSPSTEADRAVFLLVHEDWAALGKIGVAAVDPLLKYISGEGENEQAIETLQKIVEKESRRIPVDQLRKIIRFGDGASQKSEGSTAIMVRPATASLAKTAKYELLRRGILK